MTESALSLEDVIVEYAMDRRQGHNDPFDVDPLEQWFEDLHPDHRASTAESLARLAEERGGWHAFGAEELMVRALGWPVEDPRFLRILNASLSFQRESGVWEGELSPAELMYWKEAHPGESWLTPRPLPSREEVTITPLAGGEERHVATMRNSPQSNRVFVSCPALGVFKSFVDSPDGEGGHVRQDGDTAPDLYGLYSLIGNHTFMPNYWNHPELEPFFPFPQPTI